MNKITIKNKNIDFQKNYSKKAKNIKLAIKNNILILTIPKPSIFQSIGNIEKKALDFLQSKSDWILKNIKEEKENNPDITNFSRKHYLENKQKAKLLCTEKCMYWSSKMNLQYNNISIKSLRTRWGSCSSKKNLNFSYKILFLEQKDIDYLIVHELSHIAHMNHSKSFWDLVCETLESEEFRKYKIKV